MKKFSASLLFAGCLISSSVALADNHTVSVGYAQGKVEDLHNIKGVNLQYRYETDFPIGVLISTTYQSGDKDKPYGFEDLNLDVKTFSFQTGPVYRVNSFASIYGTIGFSYNKVKLSYDDSYTWLEISENNTEFAYGAGVIINPTSNLSVNVGYEGTKASLWGESAQINGFNVGIGYRF